MPTPDEVMAECERIAKHADLSSLVLLRIYFYDAPPAGSKLTNPIDGRVTDLATTHVYRTQKGLLDALELKPNVAIRKGDISVRGWQVRDTAIDDIAKTKRPLAASDLSPNIQQKGVDLRIGLDIARLSLMKLVDTIVVVTGDSDMIPAFRFARREGIRIYLDHLGGPVNRELRVHADIVI
jgi:uncharacterized LabA/DUF88 family protein